MYPTLSICGVQCTPLYNMYQRNLSHPLHLWCAVYSTVQHVPKESIPPSPSVVCSVLHCTTCTKGIYPTLSFCGVQCTPLYNMYQRNLSHPLILWCAVYSTVQHVPKESIPPSHSVVCSVLHCTTCTKGIYPTLSFCGVQCTPLYNMYQRNVFPPSHSVVCSVLHCTTCTKGMHSHPLHLWCAVYSTVQHVPKEIYPTLSICGVQCTPLNNL